MDTANRNNDIAALKNVMNEFYSRDISRKIRSSFRARSKAGLYRCSYAPFGYRKAPDNHNKLVVDGETAWVVKRTEQVACPSWWLHTRNEKDYSWRFENPENKYEWAPCVIRGIIGNPIYLGHSVMCKTEVIFKVGKYRNVPDTGGQHA